MTTAEPKENLTPPAGSIEHGLWCALYNAPDAFDRWKRRVEQSAWEGRTLTDEEMTAAIAQEFGIWGQLVQPVRVVYTGQRRPRFWMDADVRGARSNLPTLAGAELVRLARLLVETTTAEMQRDGCK